MDVLSDILSGMSVIAVVVIGVIWVVSSPSTERCFPPEKGRYP
jgi:hypothetical protein